MDYGFTLIPVTVLLLNHSGSVTIRFTLLDNRAVAIPITITIMAFANAHASAHRTNSNSNIVRQSRRRNGSYGSNHQNVLHSIFLHCEPLVLMKPVVESSRNLSELLLESFSVGPFFCVGNDEPARNCRPVMSAIRSLPVPPVRADFRI
jgi:hypothetical protein